MTEQQKRAIARAADMLDSMASEMDLTFLRGRRWEGSEAQKGDRDEYRQTAAMLRTIKE